MIVRSLLVNASALTPKPTGISTYINNLIPNLSKLPSVFLTAYPVQGLTCQVIPQGMAPELGLKGHLKRLFWMQFRLVKIFKTLNCSLLFSPLLESPINNRDCRFVVTAHDIIPLRFPRNFSPLTNYFRYYVPLILDQSEHIICDSVSTARDLTDFYSISSSKLTVVPLAYDSSHFRPKVTSMRTGNYFLYLGRQDPYKNLQRLLQAFSLIAKNEEYELWLAGPEDKRYTPTLRAYAQELGLGERVKFLSYVTYKQLPELISNAMAFVFPTLWEGFGLPPLEAMACGTPVIVSNISSLPEVVGDAAIAIDPYNVCELADAMRLLANDSQLQQRLRQLGLERAKQFSWEKTGQATVNILETFL
ncbi:glycosyltransferase family 4 protein [Leptothoe kymatousa]|uniref:Glycosyltransferase family 4 protein n=1 Tax=Leptothoe kymatousa TAU-MAC 1615 TaxID=2364775 RepID=A0ABS5Y5A2_9CYAN|nr:glycosyltransferase family 1 protein [Leptothoe kymatousa]MBT9312997.1 glycosyltransferase family 4 protein [Leptothoe kymatousa TAU-MAC 1615]